MWNVFGYLSIKMHVLGDKCSYRGFTYICFDSYVLKNEKADVYRLPYLSSGGPGFGTSIDQIQ